MAHITPMPWIADCNYNSGPIVDEGTINRPDTVLGEHLQAYQVIQSSYSPQVLADTCPDFGTGNYLTSPNTGKAPESS